MYQYKFTTAEDAVKAVTSNSRVYVHGTVSAPELLTDALTKRHKELKNVEICETLAIGNAPYADPIYKDSFFVNSFFIGANVRHTLKNGNGSYIPVFLSECPLLFKQNILPIDTAFIQVSPPDKHGYCSLGVCIIDALAAIENAKYVIALVNEQMPRTHGKGIIHISKIDKLVKTDTPVTEFFVPKANEIENKISDYVAELIEDRSTLQIGIGTVPTAVLDRLKNHKDLGIHTEMFSDGVVDLYEKGVITGAYKGIHKHKIVTTFLMGSKRLYDFVDDNPVIEMYPSDYTNSPEIIRKNPKMVSVNSAIQIDLTGQVCADSIGHKLYSGVGGQVDYVRGASLSEGGKAIIALTSTTNKGISRIVSTLNYGAGVVTSRAHIRYVVTEYGVADLFGKNLQQRAKALINIAHPNHREQLEREYFENLKG
ncbi:MAG: acetyl-CoA hydrolase/transferase family protein [Flavobacteriaceae bacterium]|nr:acetyl-CoA hydrolase/transferase family protein [Flavobacteriaceae bacterium]